MVPADTACLKLYYPVELYTAILNNQPMGFYSPSVIVNDAKRHGIGILPVDSNRSRRECRPEGRRAIRIGFTYVAELGPHAIDRIEAEQPHGPFRSLPDFCRRTRLHRPAVENLIRIGAFDDRGLSRRALLWQLGEYEAQRTTVRRGPHPLLSQARSCGMTFAAKSSIDRRTLVVSRARTLMKQSRFLMPVCSLNRPI